MCGISGFFDKTGRLTQAHLHQYNLILRHRGPDGSGVFSETNQYGCIGLAHVRLSILDLSDMGKQPMKFEHLTIVFNGEIYNYKIIKQNLLSLGYEFSSSSDTEVLLKSFHAWGLDCVNRFNGMFSFAIYDNTSHKIYLCRDRAGVKPLYWYMDSQQLIFGSELKVFFNTPTFNPKIDENSLRTFMSLGYVTNENTILQGVQKAEPGSWIVFNITNQTVEVINYWSFSSLFEKEKFQGNYQEAVEETERLAQEACELRMVSDVPVGVFLSGGFDSTLITTLLQKERSEKLKTFTIGFSDGVDESKDAEKIAMFLGTHHTSYDCSQRDAMELIPLLPELYDDPIADISCIPTMLVSKLTKKDVSVALSGDGGDELFGGYDGFKTYPLLLQQINQIPLKNIVGSFLKQVSPLFKGNINHLQKKVNGLGCILTAQPHERVYQMYINKIGLPTELIDNLLLKKSDIIEYKNTKKNLIDPLDDLFILGYEDMLTNLLLVKVDRATMGFSLEGREPLLDFKLTEFAAQLPFSYKHNGIESKRPIRDIVYKYIPKELMDRPKTGFDLPIFKWLNGDLEYLIDEYLNEKKIQQNFYFNPGFVSKLVTQFKKGQLRYPSLIWRLLIIQMWSEKWMKLNSNQTI